MSDALLIGGVALVAYLWWKKRKPCCAECAGAQASTPTAQPQVLRESSYAINTTDAYGSLSIGEPAQPAIDVCDNLREACA